MQSEDEAAGAPEPPELPQLLAVQVELIRAQLAPEATGEDILRYVDAAVLNLCEHVEIEMSVLNRVMAMRAAAERLSQVRDDPAVAADDHGTALARAEAELAALEAALATARPSQVTVALGQGW